MTYPPNHPSAASQWPAPPGAAGPPGTPPGPPGGPGVHGGPGAPGSPVAGAAGSAGAGVPPGWAAWPTAAPPARIGSHPKGAPLGLAIISLISMALAASIPFDSTMWWATITAWAVFGVLACGALVLAVAGVLGTAQQWTYSAIAAACVIATWVLIALPSVASNTGFAATVSALAAFGSVALLPGRRI